MGYRTMPLCQSKTEKEEMVMNTAVYMTAIICITLVLISVINKKK